MTRASTRMIVSAGIALLAPRSSVAAEHSKLTDSYEDIDPDAVADVHARFDAYYQRGPRALGESLRAFDTETNALSLGLLRATIAHGPAPFGFRLDAGIGDTANGFLQSDPAGAHHPSLSRAFSYVQQGFATAVVPVAGRSLTVDVGKFGTPVGLEENEALSNWNYSRSLLYTLAEPTYHVGARATWEVTDDCDVALLWVNGWNANLLDGSGMRTFGAAAAWQIMPQLEVAVVYMAGPERAPANLASPALSLRNVVSAYGTYALTEDLSFAATMDYGHDDAGGGVSWWAIGDYVKWQITPPFAGVLRGEHLVDRGGFISGAPQDLTEITATAEASWSWGRFVSVGRLEYRRDASDAHVFGGAHRDTVTAAILLAF